MNDGEYIRAVGLRVRLLRVARRLTQEQVADLSGVGRATVGSIERGDHPAGLHSYRALAAAFGVEICVLVNEEASGPKPTKQP
jgi:transcriptional regulator with XRE-family HTH domain